MPPKQDFEGIGFLLADVSRLLRRDFDRRVRALSLTQAQWRAIAHLAREDGIKQAMLADRLEVAPITLGRLIDRLEAAGWVTRAADPEDRRASLLFLTPKAEPILDEMWAHAAEAFEDVMAGITQPMRKELVTLLERMKQNLSEAEAAADQSSTQGTTDHVRRRQEPKRSETR
jgi:MarR family transcriptional regulator, transcriptional regulator for hemolysin